MALAQEKSTYKGIVSRTRDVERVKLKCQVSYVQGPDVQVYGRERRCISVRGARRQLAIDRRQVVLIPVPPAALFEHKKPIQSELMVGHLLFLAPVFTDSSSPRSADLV